MIAQNKESSCKTDERGKATLTQRLAEANEAEKLLSEVLLGFQRFLIDKEQDAVDDVQITQGKITSSNRKALNYFLGNPFRILGLPRTARTEDARIVMEKYKKLERLKAIASYIAPFHLKHFAIPDRSSAVIQAIISTVEDVSNRFFWFANPNGCLAWQSVEYRELDTELQGSTYDAYDIFLANYLYAILYDPSFSDNVRWFDVFGTMERYIKKGEQIAALFVGADQVKDIGKLFEEKISQPIVALIEDATICVLKNLYVLLKNRTGLGTISKKLDARLTIWFKAETSEIDKAIDALGEGENAESEKIREAKKLYERLNSSVKPQLTWAEQHYPAKSVRLTMFQDEYRATGWNLMVFLFKAGHKTDAQNIATAIEQYCNDEQKGLIKHIIREIPRPPIPPENEHYDLGYVIAGYSELKIVEVTLNFSANVYLMENSDFNAYMACTYFNYYGGRAIKSPYRIKIPHSGHWHLIVDDGPGGLGGVRSSASVRTISNSYY